MTRNTIDIAEGDFVLKTEFVDPDYFLLRVRHFERQYNLSWGKFLGEYASGQRDSERENPDFVEWAFLCRNFLSELIRSEEEGEGPPGSITSVSPDEPEADSGFCFWARSVLRKLNVRCRGILRACGESSPVMPGREDLFRRTEITPVDDWDRWEVILWRAHIKWEKSGEVLQIVDAWTRKRKKHGARASN